MLHIWARELRQHFQRPPRILILERDRYTLELLQTALQAIGCEPVLASGADDIWAQLAATPCDLLIFGQTTAFDPLPLCRQLKEAPHTQHLPIILLTIQTAEQAHLAALEAGVDEVLVKPFSTLALLMRLRALLRLKHLHDLLKAQNTLLRQTLNRYLDAELAQHLLQDPEHRLRLGGETRTVTVLFADLRNFTPFAERYPAAIVVETLNTIFSALTEEIFRHQGTFDKYLGDAIMALFGAPLALPNAAHRALEAALAMRQRFTALQQSAPPRAPIRVLPGLGIGVHTGEAVVGNIGSERIMDYTAVGSTVNLARRLQELARSNEILISEATLREVPNAQASFVAQIGLPGHQDPISIYRLEHVPPSSTTSEPDLQG